MINLIAEFFKLFILLNIKEKIIKGIVKLRTSLMPKLTEYKKIFISTGTKFPNKTDEMKIMSSKSNISSVK